MRLWLFEGMFPAGLDLSVAVHPVTRPDQVAALAGRFDCIRAKVESWWAQLNGARCLASHRCRTPNPGANASGWCYHDLGS